MSVKNAPKTKWCDLCGTQAPSDALYCPHCGEPIESIFSSEKSISSEGVFAKEAENTGKSYGVAPDTFIPPKPSILRIMLYKGNIRGLVTGETISRVSTDRSSGANRYGVYFVMKLDEGIGVEGIPEEILVLTSRFGYFSIGDKVILQGRIFKTVLREWGRPMYTIRADNFYNESLQIGREGLMDRSQVLHKGIIRGWVTRGSIISDFATCFVIKLEENNGIARVPDEILVRCIQRGYFRKGDKVVLEGKIIKRDLKKWNRPMYTINAEHCYNTSLQIGGNV
jgi:hypothetical protein